MGEGIERSTSRDREVRTQISAQKNMRRKAKCGKRD